MQLAELDELQNLVLNPPDLSSSEVDELRILIQTNPADLRTRIKLIGHSYYTEHSTAWHDYFMWLIENVPEHPILGRIGDMIIDEIDPIFYQNLKLVWQLKIDEHPDLAQVFVNAAASVLISDVICARKYVNRAFSLSPNSFEVLRMQKKLIPLEKFEAEWREQFPED